MKRLKRFARWLLGLDRPTRYYFVNGKEVSQAQWYINGGLEVEEDLDEAIRELNRGR